jgi:tRNA nucleotidyltransferase (CCA-adding enzyme)
MENVKRYVSFIKRIVSAPEPIRKQLLKSSNLNIIKAICELVLNILQKNISVDKAVLGKFKKHKKLLYKLLEAKGFETRKEILVVNPQIIAPLHFVLK